MPDYRAFRKPLSAGYTFEVSSNSKRFEEKKESEKVLIKEVEVNKPIHIEVPKYIHVPGPTKTIVKIKEVEKKVEVRSYIVEINNFNGKNSQEFFISGIESLQIDVSGDTKIEASEGRIAIDFSKSSVKKIRFKGILISEEDNLKNNLNSALIKFNETTGQIYHYDNKSCMAYLFVGGEYRNTHADGLIIVSDFEGKIGKFSSSQHYKDDFEYLQKIRSKCGVPYQHETLGGFDGLIITTGGIGIRLNELLYKKNIFGKKEKIIGLESRDIWKYYDWKHFANLEFAKSESRTDNRVYIKDKFEGNILAFISYHHFFKILPNYTNKGHPEKIVGFYDNQIIELLTEIQFVIAKR